MKAYVYKAALLCESCGSDMQVMQSAHKDNLDSDHYPQGPYSDGGGEADSPQHCDICRLFLENPLTDDGREYVAECLESYPESGNGEILKQWADFYGFDFPPSPANPLPD